MPAIATTAPEPRGRLLGAAEWLLGAGVVLGHNVFRVVPNEVLVLLVVGLVSLRLRGGGVAAVGLVRPASWRRIVAIAVAAATLRIGLGDGIVVPLASQFWPPPVETAAAAQITGNLGMAALALIVVWTFAAFGEEFVYRGYLARRAADALGGTAPAWWIAIVASAVLFGLGHYYKGPVGVLDSTLAGLILGGAYLLAGRNLWASILAHGFIDTVAVVYVYLGMGD